jgi:hypothetical protein
MIAKIRELLRRFYVREKGRLFSSVVIEDSCVLYIRGVGNAIQAEFHEDTTTADGRQGRERRIVVLSEGGRVSLTALAGRKFDYIVLDDVVSWLTDVQSVLTEVGSVCGAHTRILLTWPSNVWRPVLTLASALGVRSHYPEFNWLSSTDVRNLLSLAGFEVVVAGGRMLCPVNIPGVAPFLNRFMTKLPGIGNLSLLWYAVARLSPAGFHQAEYSVSVMIPTRNERGNVEPAFQRLPKMGKSMELIFVDGHSTDGTFEEIERCALAYRDRWPRVLLLKQTGKGKGQAVRQGFAEASGDILMILDSDLTMPPEDLPKYYEVLTRGRGELINGCRLVYPKEGASMRYLNMVANHFFAKLFTWLLGQPVKDTLCGTKVLWLRDYEAIARNREYFGDFDPFGDFDLLFGGARLSRKIVDLPIRYRDRQYGDIKIDRWRDGWLLLRMSWLAFRKLKLQ